MDPRPTLLSICLFVANHFAFSQLYTEEAWQNTLGSYQEDYPSTIVPCPGGKFLIAGYSNSSLGYDKTEAHIDYAEDDYWVVMVDSLGNKLWDEMYGGDGNDVLTKALLLPDGGFLFAGKSASGAGYDRTEENMGSGEDYWVVRTDSLGNALWDAAYGGNEWDHLYDAILTADNGFLLIGWSRSHIGFDKSEDPIGWTFDRDYWIVKIDSMGVLEWENTIGGTEADEAYAGIQTSDGGYIIAGKSQSPISADKTEPVRGVGSTQPDYWIVKLSADGEVEWDKTIGGTNQDTPDDIAQLDEHHFIISGYSSSAVGYDKTSSGFGGLDYWIVKIDDEGNKLWDRSIGGTGSDFGTAVSVSQNNLIVVAGSSWSPISGLKSEANRGYADYWIVGLDTMGNFVWDDVIGCDDEDIMSDVYLFDDGSVLLAGSSESDTCADKLELNKAGGTNEADFFVVKMNPYNSLYVEETISICADSTAILQNGQVVDSTGDYYFTIEGDVLDTLFITHVIQTEINDSITNYDYYLNSEEGLADEYIWIDCSTGEIVSYDNMSEFWPYYDGFYAVIIYKNGCIDTSDCYYAYGVDVNDIHTNSYLQISPNPGSGMIAFSADQQIEHYVIFNMTGNMIANGDVYDDTGKIIIPISTPGMYIISWITQNGNYQTPYILR